MSKKLKIICHHVTTIHILTISMISIISRLLTTLIPIYLPFDDMNLKITVGMALAELIISLLDCSVKYMRWIFSHISFFSRINYLKIAMMDKERVPNEIYDLLL